MRKAECLTLVITMSVLTSFLIQYDLPASTSRALLWWVKGTVDIFYPDLHHYVAAHMHHILFMLCLKNQCQIIVFIYQWKTEPHTHQLLTQKQPTSTHNSHSGHQVSAVLSRPYSLLECPADLKDKWGDLVMKAACMRPESTKSDSVGQADGQG